MSQENVEIARRAILAFNATEVGAFTALTTHDFEWFPSMLAIEGQSFRGSEGIHSYFASLGDAWDEFIILPAEFRDLSELVIMLGGLRGLGKNSGVPVDAELGMVFGFRSCEIMSIHGYLDHREALAAAGLTEKDAH